MSKRQPAGSRCEAPFCWARRFAEPVPEAAAGSLRGVPQPFRGRVGAVSGPPLAVLADLRSSDGAAGPQRATRMHQDAGPSMAGTYEDWLPEGRLIIVASKRKTIGPASWILPPPPRTRGRFSSAAGRQHRRQCERRRTGGRKNASGTCNTGPGSGGRSDMACHLQHPVASVVISGSGPAPVTRKMTLGAVMMS